MILGACVASIASDPAAPVVEGALEDREVVLEPGASRSVSFRAFLADGGEGRGEIALACAAREGASGAFELALVSDTTGEKAEAAVDDVADTPETVLVIDAFTGCTSGPCEERGTVTFTRADAGGSAPLEMEWRLDARFYPAGGAVEGNAIDISILDE